MEGPDQILDKKLFYLSCCQKVGDSKAMGEGMNIELCDNGVCWSWKNEVIVRTLG